MIRKLGLQIALALFATLGCTQKAPEPSAEDIQSARRAANEFDQEIQRLYIDRIEREEPPSAVYLAYRGEIENLRKEISEKYGVEIRRTGLRVRNRNNVADDWEYEKLEALEFSINAGLAPATLSFAEIVQTDKKEKAFRWIKPVMIKEACLPCHGEEISEPILDLLNAEYPEDESTGFFENELGGAYSVTKVLD